MRQPSTIFEQFEIAVVPFPFVDAPRTKPRPALVLSVGQFNRENGHTLLAMITSAKHTRWPSDYAIRDLAPTGLRVACVVRWKLFTLDNRLMRPRIGHLGNRDARDCRAALGRILDGWRPA
ncbi:MAG: type II toxin-antitoxin system PemK/MazF family toxin [Geminicoccaceae bacterium]